MDIESKVVHGISETIRAIQERKPRILGTSGLGQRNELARSGTSDEDDYGDLSSTQVLIATTDDESQQLRFGSEFSELKWISTDIPVPELVVLLTNNLGSRRIQ